MHYLKQSLLLLALVFAHHVCATECFDIVIYGGTSSGVIAAVQAARLGKSVALIHPGKHLGGMTSSGLGWIDIGNPRSIGGLTKDFFHHIWLHYQNDVAWTWEDKHLMKIQGDTNATNDTQTMWVLEPHVAESTFTTLCEHPNIIILYNERLNRRDGVTVNDATIQQIEMQSGRIIQGKIYIDATYEGDLLAAAGVSYIIGREPNTLHHETMNGIRTNILRGDMPKRIDPYIIKGNPASGLLPRVYSHAQGPEGGGDTKLQAYNFRMCLTDIPENRIFIEKPQDYNENDYELVFRMIEGGLHKSRFFKLDLLPNRKTDSNNHGPVSTDYVGMNWDYVEADDVTRHNIALAHEKWQKGLVWTLQNHPRIPAPVQAYYAPWGLAKDEFIDNNHWPYQLYIREARRMVADVVITEHTALGHHKENDSIGLGSYHIDSHAIKYFVAHDGFLVTDGCLYHKVSAPFPISYRTIIPKRTECNNLLVPICLSATHAAYGSVRMEPVFMVLGQSAATAASIAIDLNLALQDVPYETLRAQLLKDKQIINWPQ